MLIRICSIICLEFNCKLLCENDVCGYVYLNFVRVVLELSPFVTLILKFIENHGADETIKNIFVY